MADATPIHPLRQRMIDDMTLRGFGPSTQRSYIGAVRRCAAHVRKPPRFALVLSALSFAACAGPRLTETSASDLPGSAAFPLVAGSAIAPCPADWLFETPRHVGPSIQPVCVAAPSDNRGGAIVDAYKRILDERGFRFGRYLGGPSVVMLTRRTGSTCDLMTFGLPYLPPEQRTHRLLMFKLDHVSVEDCSQIEREGRN
jgi:hypothetical protein